MEIGKLILKTSARVKSCVYRHRESLILQVHAHFFQTSSWLRRHSRDFGRKVSKDFALLGGLTNGGGGGDVSEAAASTEHHNKRRAHAREAR